MISAFIRKVCETLAGLVLAYFFGKRTEERDNAREDAKAFEQEAQRWSNRPSGDATVIRLRDAAQKKRNSKS